MTRTAQVPDGAGDDRPAGEVLAVEWWRMHAVPNLAPRTLEVYLHIWEKHMRARLGGYQLRAITPEIVEDFRIQLQAQKVGDPTFIKAMGLLQGILKRAVVRGHILPRTRCWSSTSPSSARPAASNRSRP